MRTFVDTSVLLASVQGDHPHHDVSLERVSGLALPDSFCSGHTLAELYSTLTRMPAAVRFEPEHARIVLDDILLRLRAVTLSGREYAETIRRAAREELRGGLIYDAVHLACARKIDAEKIYTWDVRHFRRVAPDLVDRIVEP